MNSSSKNSKRSGTGVNQSSSRQMRSKGGGADRGGGAAGGGAGVNRLNPVSEVDLLKKDQITPDDVLRLTRATEGCIRLFQ